MKSLTSILADHIRPRRRMRKIWAITTIRNGPEDLLPHWRNHYLAFDQVIVRHNDAGVVKRADADYFDAPMRPLNDEYLWHYSALRMCEAQPDDWIIWTDLDEFHEWPDDMTASECFDAAEADGFNAIYGEMIDRHAPNGELTPLLAGVPIHKQYPIRSRFTSKAFGGLTQKCLACKYHILIGGGHHHAHDAAVFSKRGTTEHLKWRAGSYERLKGWIDHPVAHPKWRVETRNCLKIIDANAGRIPVEKYAIQP